MGKDNQIDILMKISANTASALKQLEDIGKVGVNSAIQIDGAIGRIAKTIGLLGRGKSSTGLAAIFKQMNDSIKTISGSLSNMDKNNVFDKLATNMGNFSGAVKNVVGDVELLVEKLKLLSNMKVGPSQSTNRRISTSTVSKESVVEDVKNDLNALFGASKSSSKSSGGKGSKGRRDEFKNAIYNLAVEQKITTYDQLMKETMALKPKFADVNQVYLDKWVEGFARSWGLNNVPLKPSEISSSASKQALNRMISSRISAVNPAGLSKGASTSAALLLQAQKGSASFSPQEILQFLKDIGIHTEDLFSKKALNPTGTLSRKDMEEMVASAALSKSKLGTVANKVIDYPQQLIKETQSDTKKREEEVLSGLKAEKDIENKRVKEVIRDAKAEQDIYRRNKGERFKQQGLSGRIGSFQDLRSWTKKFGGNMETDEFDAVIRNTNLFKNNADNVKELAEHFHNLRAGYMGMKTPVDQFGKSLTWVDQIINKQSDALERLARYYISFATITAVQRTFQRQVQDTIDLYDGLKDVQKYLPSGSNIGDMREGAYGVATKYGVTIKEVVGAYSEFAQQGLQVNEILAATNTAFLGANVAGIQFSESVKFLVTATQNWNIAMANSSILIDKLALVQAKSAVTGAALIQIIQRSASMAQQAGMSPDMLMGMGAAITEKTQLSGEVVGTSIKTIIERAQRSATFSGLKNISAFKDIQFADKITGQLMSVEKILGIVASKWMQLTDVERKYVGELMAGGRQINAFTALMNNFDKAIGLSKESMNAFGFAAKANESEMSKFSKTMTAFTSGMLSGGTDALTPFLAAFNYLLQGVTSSLSAFPVLNKTIITVATSLVAARVASGVLGASLIWLGKIGEATYLKMNPIVTVIGAIAVAAGSWYYNASQKSQDMLQKQQSYYDILSKTLEKLKEIDKITDPELRKKRMQEAVSEQKDIIEGFPSQWKERTPSGDVRLKSSVKAESIQKALSMNLERLGIKGESSSSDFLTAFKKFKEMQKDYVDLEQFKSLFQALRSNASTSQEAIDLYNNILEENKDLSGDTLEATVSRKFAMQLARKRHTNTSDYEYAKTRKDFGNIGTLGLPAEDLEKMIQFLDKSSVKEISQAIDAVIPPDVVKSTETRAKELADNYQELKSSMKQLADTEAQMGQNRSGKWSLGNDDDIAKLTAYKKQLDDVKKALDENAVAQKQYGVESQDASKIDEHSTEKLDALINRKDFLEKQKKAASEILYEQAYKIMGRDVSMIAAFDGPLAKPGDQSALFRATGKRILDKAQFVKQNAELEIRKLSDIRPGTSGWIKMTAEISYAKDEVEKYKKALESVRDLMDRDIYTEQIKGIERLSIALDQLGSRTTPLELTMFKKGLDQRFSEELVDAIIDKNVLSEKYFNVMDEALTIAIGKLGSSKDKVRDARQNLNQFLAEFQINPISRDTTTSDLEVIFNEFGKLPIFAGGGQQVEKLNELRKALEYATAEAERAQASLNGISFARLIQSFDGVQSQIFKTIPMVNDLYNQLANLSKDWMVNIFLNVSGLSAVQSAINAVKNLTGGIFGSIQKQQDAKSAEATTSIINKYAEQTKLANEVAKSEIEFKKAVKSGNKDKEAELSKSIVTKRGELGRINEEIRSQEGKVSPKSKADIEAAKMRADAQQDLYRDKLSAQEQASRAGQKMSETKEHLAAIRDIRNLENEISQQKKIQSMFNGYLENSKLRQYDEDIADLEQKKSMYEKWGADTRLKPEEQEKYKNQALEMADAIAMAQKYRGEVAKVDAIEKKVKENKFLMDRAKDMFAFQQQWGDLQFQKIYEPTYGEKEDFAVAQQMEKIEFERAMLEKMRTTEIDKKTAALTAQNNLAAENLKMSQEQLQAEVDKQMAQNETIKNQERAVENAERELLLVRERVAVERRKEAMAATKEIQQMFANTLAEAFDFGKRKKELEPLLKDMAKLTQQQNYEGLSVAGAEMAGNVDQINSAREKWFQTNQQIGEVRDKMNDVNNKTKIWKDLLSNIGSSIMKKIADVFSEILFKKTGLAEGLTGMFGGLFGMREQGRSTTSSALQGIAAGLAPGVGGWQSILGGNAGPGGGANLLMSKAASMMGGAYSGGAGGNVTQNITVSGGGGGANLGGLLGGSKTKEPLLGGKAMSYLGYAATGYALGGLSSNKGTSALLGAAGGFLMGGGAIGAIIGGIAGLFGSKKKSEDAQPAPPREFYPLVKNSESLDRNTAALMKLSEGMFNAPAEFQMNKMQLERNSSGQPSFNIVVRVDGKTSVGKVESVERSYAASRNNISTVTTAQWG